MSFSDDIRKFAKKTNKRIEDVMQASAISVFSSIVLRTPVDTGRARANWLYSQDEPRTDTTEKTKAPIMSRQVKKGLNHIISNNLPYIEKLESGDGSAQAPNGMVKVTTTEFEAVVKKAVKSK